MVSSKLAVASAGIEPASGASEALILSIVLRGQKKFQILELRNFEISQ